VVLGCVVSPVTAVFIGDGGVGPPCLPDEQAVFTCRSRHTPLPGYS
jgi:hypothetical protein